MNRPRNYLVAGICLQLTEPHFLFHGLQPFATAEQPTDTPYLRLTQGSVEDSDKAYVEIDRFDFADVNADCHLERAEDCYRFSMVSRHGARTVHFWTTWGSDTAMTDFCPDESTALIRFGLWMMFNLRAVALGVVAIHSSVIRYRDAGALFLGESGTGKSTHTRLWRETFAEAELLNDDSPMLSVCNDHVEVCGSPWSGKTPCYRALQSPIQGIVRLSQGPANVIRRLSVLEGYAAVQPSCPPSFIHDERLSEALNRILSALLRHVKVYHLSCLPDEAAARLSRDTLYGD